MVSCSFELIVCIDFKSGLPATEFLVPIQETLERLLSQEDTDNDYKITVDDKGPKVKKNLIKKLSHISLTAL